MIDRITWLRCKAANEFQLAACYQEQAENYMAEANRLDRDGDGWLADICNQNTGALPDNWMEIAEMPEPKNTPATEVGHG